MKLKLKEIADVFPGSILTRIRPNSKFDEILELDTISMQELSYVTGQSDNKNDSSISKVSKKNINNCVFTDLEDVVIGLNAHKAMVIRSGREHKLLLSNFACIRIHDTNKLDPNYLSWLFNESKSFRRSMSAMVQGMAYVNSISIKAIREFDIDLVDIELQKKIGKLYVLGLQRYIISKEICNKKRLEINLEIESLAE